MQDVPIGREFRCPHFLHWVSGSSLQISIFSPHFWHLMSSGLGWRISMLPGHPSLNIEQYYTSPGGISMMHIIRNDEHGAWGKAHSVYLIHAPCFLPYVHLLLYHVCYLYLKIIRKNLPVNSHGNKEIKYFSLEAGCGFAVKREQRQILIRLRLLRIHHAADRHHRLMHRAMGRNRLG